MLIKFQVIGDVILFGGQRVGELDLPAGTLRDDVVMALENGSPSFAADISAAYDRGFSEGLEHNE